MKWCAVVMLGATLLLATACESNKKPVHHDFGNAVRQNMFVHIIKPRVPDPNAAPSDLEGARALRAIDRYHKGETEELEKESTRKAEKGGK